MATRLYFSSTVPPVSPGFAGWTRTSEGVYRSLLPWKDQTAGVSLTFWANAAAAVNDTCLCMSLVTPPMEAGIAFTTTDTAKMVAMARESATNDNINRSPCCVKVYSFDGATLRATLLALGHYGPNTTEWLSTGLRNKQFLDGDALATAGYTTVQGDRLVVEMGGQIEAVTGGTTVTGTIRLHSNAAGDLAENETNTTDTNDPWFEHSRAITFMNEAGIAQMRGAWRGMGRGGR